VITGAAAAVLQRAPVIIPVRLLLLLLLPAHPSSVGRAVMSERVPLPLLPVGVPVCRPAVVLVMIRDGGDAD